MTAAKTAANRIFCPHRALPFRGNGVQDSVDPPEDGLGIGLRAGDLRGHSVPPELLQGILLHRSFPPFVRVSRRAFRPRWSRLLAVERFNPRSRAPSRSLSPVPVVAQEQRVVGLLHGLHGPPEALGPLPLLDRLLGGLGRGPGRCRRGGGAPAAGGGAGRRPCSGPQRPARAAGPGRAPAPRRGSRGPGTRRRPPPPRPPGGRCPRWRGPATPRCSHRGYSAGWPAQGGAAVLAQPFRSFCSSKGLPPLHGMVSERFPRGCSAWIYAPAGKRLRETQKKSRRSPAGLEQSRVCWLERGPGGAAEHGSQLPFTRALSTAAATFPAVWEPLPPSSTATTKA